MQQVARETVVAYERRLEQAKVPAPQRPHYHKWTRFYLDFCHKYGHPPRAAASLTPFLHKLAAKNQSVQQREQAAHAIRLLIGPPPQRRSAQTAEKPNAQPASALAPPSQHPAAAPRPAALPPPPRAPVPLPPRPQAADDPSANPTATSPPPPGRGASWQNEYRDLEASIKMRNYSRKTLAAYRFWVAKFQSFVRSRPTAEVGAPEVRVPDTSAARRRPAEQGHLYGPTLDRPSTC